MALVDVDRCDVAEQHAELNQERLRRDGEDRQMVHLSVVKALAHPARKLSLQLLLLARPECGVAIALRGNASTLQIVSASRPFVEAAEVRFDAVTSVAGFTTYTARWPVGASAPRSLRVRFDDPSASSPLVRLAVDVYAFDGVRAR